MWLLLGQALKIACPMLPAPVQRAWHGQRFFTSSLQSFMFLRKGTILSYRYVEECREKRFQMRWLRGPSPWVMREEWRGSAARMPFLAPRAIVSSSQAPQRQKAKACRLPSMPPVKTRTILALKAAGRPGKQISLAPIPARARAVSHGHRPWHLEMERTAAGTSCQGKVASVRSTAACLDWRVTEHVSGTGGFYTFLTFCFSAQLSGCCFNHPATTVLDHWCFEIVFVAKKNSLSLL